MEPVKDYFPPNRTETPVTTIDRQRYICRFALARSLDSQNAAVCGQDVLKIREDGERLAFALCDGVSQSFFGDLGASFLCNQLIEWLWLAPKPDRSLSQNRGDLNAFLIQLIPPASEAVFHYKLPPTLPSFLEYALEEKRKQGTEAMFVCGICSPAADWCFFAWMGDSRLRIWGPQQERTNELGNALLSRERWSSCRGPVGDVHGWQNHLSDIARIEAYSDGLAVLDGMQSDERLESDHINATIADMSTLATNDDISFIEVAFKDVKISQKVRANRITTGALLNFFYGKHPGDRSQR